jgi:Arc/MetJ family transcription regulator
MDNYELEERDGDKFGNRRQFLEKALIIGGLKTKKDTVNLALDEFIQRRKRQEAVELFGKIEFDKNYDYKKSRRKR